MNNEELLRHCDQVIETCVPGFTGTFSVDAHLKVATALRSLLTLEQGMDVNRLELKAEEVDCVHMSLDDRGIPRVDSTGKTYSLWGRILLYSRDCNVREEGERSERPIDGAAVLYIANRLWSGFHRINLGEFEQIIKETIGADSSYARKCWRSFEDNQLGYCMTRSPISQGDKLILLAFDKGHDAGPRIATLQPPTRIEQQAVPHGWRPVPIESLKRILMLIDPPPFEKDGNTYTFENPRAANILTALSSEIRLMLAASPSASPGTNVGDKG